MKKRVLGKREPAIIGAIVLILLLIAAAGTRALYNLVFGSWDTIKLIDISPENHYRCEVREHYYNGGAQVDAVVILSERSGSDERWEELRRQSFYLDSAGKQYYSAKWEPNSKVSSRLALQVTGGSAGSSEEICRWPCDRLTSGK